MLLSKRCEYGLRAMLYLSSLDSEGEDGAPDPTQEYLSIETISESLDIGFSFLTKVFQQLNEAGLLTSKRGPGGGVALTRAPGDISLYEIVVAIDGTALFEECVLGLPGCGEAEPCPLHEHWTAERERMETTFRETTLAEVPDVRLTPFLEESTATPPGESS
jgi:Rrf2 family iron-sulfur cluster assembly transcriptional regulator